MLLGVTGCSLGKATQMFLQVGSRQLALSPWLSLGSRQKEKTHQLPRGVSSVESKNNSLSKDPHCPEGGGSPDTCGPIALNFLPSSRLVPSPCNLLDTPPVYFPSTLLFFSFQELKSVSVWNFFLMVFFSLFK